MSDDKSVASSLRAPGFDLSKTVQAVTEAKAKLEQAKENRTIDRKPTPAQVDKALGKDPKETVEKVEDAAAVAQAIAAPQTPPAPAEEPPKPDREEEFRKREKKLVDGQSRLRTEREQFDAYRRKVEQEIVMAREMAHVAKTDPLAYLERYHGVKRETLFGSQQPPAQPGPARSPALPPEVAQELEESRAWRRQQEERAKADSIEREKEKFASEARAGADKWPLASKYSADKLKARGYELAVTNARTGVILSNEEILDKIEEELSEIASLASPKPTPATPKPTASPGPEEKRTTHPTLTTGGLSESSGVPRSPLKMSRRERIEAAVQAVEEARRARSSQ